MKLIKKGAITLVVVGCRKDGDGRNWCTSLSRRDFAVRSGDVARLPPVASKWKVCGSGAWRSYVRRGWLGSIVVVVAVWYCIILHCLYINVSTVKWKREKKNIPGTRCVCISLKPCPLSLTHRPCGEKKLGSRDAYMSQARTCLECHPLSSSLPQIEPSNYNIHNFIIIHIPAAVPRRGNSHYYSALTGVWTTGLTEAVLETVFHSS